MMAQSKGFTATIRERVWAKAKVCPTCHQPTLPGGMRTAAFEIGIGHSTLWRFLQGLDVTGRNLDKIIAWLER